MTQFPIHTVDTAPEGSRPFIAGARAAFGLVPNLVGEFAESPAVIEGYRSLAGAYQKSDLTPLEREIVLIAASVENACHYCVAAHTTVTQGQHLDQTVIQAVRNGGPIADARLEALRDFATRVVRERGWVSDADVNRLIGAGYTAGNVLEVVLGVGLKTISNYVNHIAETPVDAAFQANAFTPRKAA
ncbi:carboxymuconolactone decarboxylase family protein [Brevundimonas subvibrioides]|uniref:Carboxymuconolactone decarboxylase n=1 Tax=Brevundimonas subvibrioides (strain ATCC 15264 / DSM 4735 / LMG 14903 / NBRC 16000 / CB 81) TaxID=633149 RepID=D9QHG7_BRESC|nr:carboxymuconolactone decarboxylase family protein [Brevundimonas subvibrioides]ADL01133.1 Carboxymuconolactone decarboxylase [Brevundimonas subvibrioides ATCC 15264]